jgi:hypothetical protein
MELHVRRTPIAVITILTLAVAGCGGSSPTSPSDVTRSQLAAAPTRIVADGKTLTLTTSLWRDFMPISPPDGRPLAAVLTIAAEDGSPVPATVTADTSWVIHGSEVWTAAVEQRPRAETAPAYEVIARNGPKWGPDVSVDVIVRLIDSSGRAFLLRAPAQPIGATF